MTIFIYGQLRDHPIHDWGSQDVCFSVVRMPCMLPSFQSERFYFCPWAGLKVVTWANLVKTIIMSTWSLKYSLKMTLCVIINSIRFVREFATTTCSAINTLFHVFNVSNNYSYSIPKSEKIPIFLAGHIRHTWRDRFSIMRSHSPRGAVVLGLERVKRGTNTPN